MSFFKVTITGGDNPIELKEQITGAEVFMDTINDNVENKSSGMLAKLTLSGKIREQDSAIFIELFNWSKDFKAKTQYRKVEMAVGGAEDTIYRSYEFGKMFVVDYKETYAADKNQNQTGEFELKLTQQDDNWESVDSFSQ